MNRFSLLLKALHVLLHINCTTDFSVNSAEVSYLNGDHATPILLSFTHYSYSEAIKIMLKCPEGKLCSKQPILVEQSCAFLVGLSKLDHADDIKADDCGHWTHNGRKSTKASSSRESARVLWTQPVP